MHSAAGQLSCAEEGGGGNLQRVEEVVRRGRDGAVFFVWLISKPWTSLTRSFWIRSRNMYLRPLAKVMLGVKGARRGRVGMGRRLAVAAPPRPESKAISAL